MSEDPSSCWSRVTIGGQRIARKFQQWTRWEVMVNSIPSDKHSGTKRGEQTWEKNRRSRGTQALELKTREDPFKLSILSLSFPERQQHQHHLVSEAQGGSLSLAAPNILTCNPFSSSKRWGPTDKQVPPLSFFFFFFFLAGPAGMVERLLCSSSFPCLPHTWHDTCLRMKKKMNFQVVETPEILKMCENIFCICQTSWLQSTEIS